MKKGFKIALSVNSQNQNNKCTSAGSSLNNYDECSEKRANSQSFLVNYRLFKNTLNLQINSANRFKISTGFTPKSFETQNLKQKIKLLYEISNKKRNQLKTTSKVIEPNISNIKHLGFTLQEMQLNYNNEQNKSKLYQTNIPTRWEKENKSITLVVFINKNAISGSAKNNSPIIFTKQYLIIIIKFLTINDLFVLHTVCKQMFKFAFNIKLGINLLQ